MKMRTIAAALGGICLALGGQAQAQLSAAFPPISVKDVDQLATAADRADLAHDAGREEVVAWNNDATGTDGTVQALESFERDGMECRKYRLVINVQGFEPYTGDPAMCKIDGAWKFVN